MPKLNWKDLRTARKLLWNETPMEKVIAALENQYTAEDIERDLAEHRAHHNLTRKERPRLVGYKPAAGWRDVDSVRTQVKIPEAQRLDREYRAGLFPISITAARMGDPLPGYSAADRAPSITPSIHHDPLDDLMFSRRKVGMRYG